MNNTEINATFQDWLLNPTEKPDFEVKDWLDLRETDHQGVLAKALIALENHGGGFLLIGFSETKDKTFTPNTKLDCNREQFNTDNVNQIIGSFAKPHFHVSIHPQVMNINGEEKTFPLLRVEGKSKIPVCTKRDTPNQKIKQLTYFMRKAGPKSEPPNSTDDWNKLLDKCMQLKRAEMLELVIVQKP